MPRKEVYAKYKERCKEHNKTQYVKRTALLHQLKQEVGCQDCGERDPVVLDFHHKDPANKSPFLKYSSERPSFRRSWHDIGLNRVLEEVEKCDVLCANYHRRREAHKRRVNHA